MRRQARSFWSVLGLLSVVALLLTGCGPSGPSWIDTGATYTISGLSSLYSKADISKLSGRQASDASSLRHAALTGLRKRGGEAAAAADLITRTLSASTRGVPVYVERAKVEGQAAYIVIEATGPPAGQLTTKRLWVLSADKGAVIFVGTR